MTWRYLNFFQYHCFIKVSIPQGCGKHGIKRVKAPCARKYSSFTLLFEQFAMTLVKKMQVLATARIIGKTSASGASSISTSDKSLQSLSPMKTNGE
jgi:hypothetical protein